MTSYLIARFCVGDNLYFVWAREPFLTALNIFKPTEARNAKVMKRVQIGTWPAINLKAVVDLRSGAGDGAPHLT